jgi:hypothetical protein
MKYQTFLSDKYQIFRPLYNNISSRITATRSLIPSGAIHIGTLIYVCFLLPLNYFLKTNFRHPNRTHKPLIFKTKLSTGTHVKTTKLCLPYGFYHRKRPNDIY